MTSLNSLNSGVESNGSAFILSPLGDGHVARVPAVSGKEVVSSILHKLPGQFSVRYSPANNLLHYNSEALRVRESPVVIPKALLVDIASQVDGSTLM